MLKPGFNVSSDVDPFADVGICDAGNPEGPVGWEEGRFVDDEEYITRHFVEKLKYLNLCFCFSLSNILSRQYGG